MELEPLSKEISETHQWGYEQQAYFGLLPKHAARRTHTAENGGRLRTVDELYAEQCQSREEFDLIEARWQERIGREEKCRRQARKVYEPIGAIIAAVR